MFLNHEEIKRLKIIDGAIDKEFTNASYYLTIDEIIDMSGKKSSGFTLKPQGMAYVIFKERLSIPSNIIGFAHVKTTLTKRGIMATNIGIIDSEYKGYVSTLLINFGKSDFYLSQGESALRITFSIVVPTFNMRIPYKGNEETKDVYIQKTQHCITHLDEKFLNLNKIEKEVESSVKSNVFAAIRNYFVVFTIGSFFIASIFQIKGCQDRNNDNVLKDYQIQLSTVANHNKSLEETVNKCKDQLKMIQDSLNAQSIELRKFKVKSQ